MKKNSPAVFVCLLFALSTAVCISGEGNLTASTNVLGHLQWRELGPAAVGGRIDDFAVNESNPDVMYVGTASGGVWKTVDGAITWKPIFEHVGAMSIGAIAIAPSDPSVLWVGTGEANNRQSSSWGNGVYKSTDAGETWTNMGLVETQHIGRVVIDPHNPNVVYVAALGHLWGPNEERGLYKTIDGGKTWNRVLFINADTGVVDVKMDPQSPGTLYAAAYQRRRMAFGFNGGGPGSAIYKTTDGGVNWKKLVKDLPYLDGADTGRIGLAIYRRNPAVVYAEVQHPKGGLYRSEDHGETWTKMSDVNPNPTYFSNFYIDPNNDLRIWVAALQGSGQNAGVAYSQDGGKTFAPARGVRVHPDFHAMWIDPANSDHIIIGVDGGMYLTHDRGLSWEHSNQIPIGQAYEVGYDMDRPYHVCAGYQDNGSACGPVATRNVNGILNSDWREVLVGDGFNNQPDQADPSLVYVESQDGSLLRLNLKTNEWANIVPEPKAGEPPYRFQWNAPIALSDHDAKTIYFGAQYLFKSTDRGDSWSVISPDLTTGVDRNTLAIMGRLPKDHILSRNYGVTWFPCITRISESPVDANVVWVGTDDGNLQVTRDGGKHWNNVVERVPGVPKGAYVSGIEPSRLGAGAAYAAFDAHRDNDFGIYVYLTTDYGKTWTRASGDLPKNDGTVHVIREDPRNKNLLFAGTEYGAYLSFDKGTHWTLLSNNLPTVRVDDIKIHPREHDLILGTHGRALWVLDDISALEQMGDQSSEAGDICLFDIRPAIEWRQVESSGGMDAQKPFAAPNPPYGALITYSLKEPTKEKVLITVTDAKGKTVRQIPGTQDAGLNRVNWDLRYPTPAEPTAEQRWAMAGGFFYRAAAGPLVEPGEYTVTLSIGKSKASKTVAVSDDPTITISAHDREARDAILMRAYTLYKSGCDGEARFRKLKASLNSLTKSWKEPDAPAVPEAVRKDTEAFSKKVDDLAPLFAGPPDPLNPPINHVPPPVQERVAHVLFILESYTALPRQRDVDQLDELTGAQEDALKRLKTLIDVDLRQLNNRYRDAGMQFIPTPASDSN